MSFKEDVHLKRPPPYLPGMPQEACRYCEENREYLKGSKKSLRIKDPIYGVMEFSWDEVVLLDTCYVQRLRRISQLSFVHFLFPSARHSRFEHSLGVAHLVKKIFDALHSKSDKKTKYKLLTHKEKKLLVYAAILHDIGHGPFSHASEEIARWINERVGLKEGPSKIHEARSHGIITTKGQCLNDILCEILSEVGIKNTDEAIKRIGAYVLHWKEDTWIKNRPLHMLINGTLDADKLDYLIRDAYNAGFKVSQAFDIDRIVHGFVLDRSNGEWQLSLEEKVVLEALGLLHGRSMEKSAVWSHHIAAITAAMMRKAVQEFIGDTVEESKLKDIRDSILKMDDYQFLEYLKKKGGGAREIALRLKNRNLYKRLMILKIDKKSMDKTLKEEMFDQEKTKITWLEKKEKEIAENAKIQPQKIIITDIKPFEEMPPGEDVKVVMTGTGKPRFEEFKEYSMEYLGWPKNTWERPTIVYLTICASPEQLNENIYDKAKNVLKKYKPLEYVHPKLRG